MQRQLNPIGYDVVSIWICVAKDDIEPESLRLHITERNTTIYDGKPWSTTRSVPLQFAHMGQSLLMHTFTEHVAEYARILEGL